MEPDVVDVVVIGVAAVDEVAQTERLPRADELVPALDFARFPGGSGANVAVGLARLGQRVGFLGELGDDANGRLLLASFRDENVDTQQCRVLEGKSSATCFITVARSGERSIVALGGAGLLDHITDADLAYIRRAKVLFVTDHDDGLVLGCLDGIRGAGVRFVYCPGGWIAARGLESMRPILARDPFLVLSRREFNDLLGETDLAAGARRLAQLGVATAAVTLGERGICLMESGRISMVPAVENPNVVDTTGSGDAFAAGLVDGLLQGMPVEKAVENGALVAAIKVGVMGARSGLPTRRQVEEFEGIHLA